MPLGTRQSLMFFPEQSERGGEGKAQHQALGEAQNPTTDDPPQAGDGAEAERTDYAKRLVAEDASGGERHAAQHPPIHTVAANAA